MKNIREKFTLPTYENRSLIKRFLARFRIITHERRALPTFLIIGAQKAGTTSLYRYLAKHPDIKPNFVVKELSFFDEYYDRGIPWYKSHFPFKRKNKHYFEGTTHYLFNPLAPKRIKDVLPNVKIIALLRNPIDRAYSSYKHQVRAGRETLSFEEAIESEKKRLKGEKERLSNESSYFSYNYNHFSYLERGKYNEQIQNWLEYFPKEQMFILSSDEFFKNTESSLNKIYNFLEIKPSQVNIKKQYNTGGYKDSMPKETREKLSIFFEPYNIELKKLLKESLDWK
jgi:hypothetical protein